MSLQVICIAKMFVIKMLFKYLKKLSKNTEKVWEFTKFELQQFYKLNGFFEISKSLNDIKDFN